MSRAGPRCAPAPRPRTAGTPPFIFSASPSFFSAGSTVPHRRGTYDFEPARLASLYPRFLTPGGRTTTPWPSASWIRHGSSPWGTYYSWCDRMGGPSHGSSPPAKVRALEVPTLCGLHGCSLLGRTCPLGAGRLCRLRGSLPRGTYPAGPLSQGRENKATGKAHPEERLFDAPRKHYYGIVEERELLPWAGDGTVSRGTRRTAEGGMTGKLGINSLSYDGRSNHAREITFVVKESGEGG